MSIHTESTDFYGPTEFNINVSSSTTTVTGRIRMKLYGVNIFQSALDATQLATLWSSNTLVGATPDPLPHLTVTPYYSNVYNQNRVSTTLFSSKADINTVYRPIVFNADVDVSNETTVKNFVETNGTIKTGFTVTRNSIGVLDEEVTHAYTGMMLLGDGETAEMSIREVDWSGVTEYGSSLGNETSVKYGEGCAISSDGKTALVSGSTSTSSGNAYVYALDGSTWTLKASPS